MERGTKTQEDQWMVESQVFRIYDLFGGLPRNSQFAMLELYRDKHIEYLTKGLKQLSRSFTVLDANRPWLCYWILHSISSLRDCVDDKLETDCIDFLSRCQDPEGGYGGGPGQMPHLATTYGAVNSLITLGGHRALSSINRRKLYEFLLRMKDRSGGFRMHDGGEVDVRACYTAVSVASVLNILDDELIQNVGDYILRALVNFRWCCNVMRLKPSLHYVVARLMKGESLVNQVLKLMGGVAALLQRLHLTVREQMGISGILECGCSTDSDYDSTSSDISEGEHLVEGTSSRVKEGCQLDEEGQPNTLHPADVNNVGYNFVKEQVQMRPLFDNIALQQYILLCSQEEEGFRDKPGKSRDYYHTCYCLSGLSVSQYSSTKNVDSPPLPGDVFGPYSNLLERVHPLYNVVLDRYYEAHEFFTRS